MIQKIPYIINIAVLVPVCAMMFFGNNKNTVQVFQGTVSDSKGLRLLVGSLWLSILLCSILALGNPKKFVSILLLQWLYKSAFLASYVIPQGLRYGIRVVPTGITVTFIAIILVWPYFIYLMWS